MSDPGQKHDLGTPDVWTQQEKDELLDFLRYYVVPQLAGEDLAHHLRTRYPSLNLTAAPRPHVPGPVEQRNRDAGGMPYDPEREKARRLVRGLEP